MILLNQLVARGSSISSVHFQLKVHRSVNHVPKQTVQETIVESMGLPSGLDVTPDDPEYEEVVNMWTAVSRNNTMDEVCHKNILEHVPNLPNDISLIVLVGPNGNISCS